jgi:hypothetical protein
MQIIAQAAKIIHKDIFQHEGLTLMSLMIFGPSIKDQQVDTQTVHTASQIVTFNAKKSSTKSVILSHPQERASYPTQIEYVCLCKNQK